VFEQVRERPSAKPSKSHSTAPKGP